MYDNFYPCNKIQRIGLMNKRSAVLLNGMLVAAIFAIAFWTIGAHPAGGQVAIHWGPDNHADAFLGAPAIQLVNPIVALVIWFLLCMAPQAFRVRGAAPQAAHGRLAGLFIAQLALQLLLAIHARGWLAL
jgi:hypothetical protein